jgi:hypothetical protein
VTAGCTELHQLERELERGLEAARRRVVLGFDRRWAASLVAAARFLVVRVAGIVALRGRPGTDA